MERSKKFSASQLFRTSTSPPFYSELGTRAKDLLEKGYLNGLIKFNCKTTNDTGMVFDVGGSLDQQTEKSNGSLDVQYAFSKHGLIFTERWNSENVLSVEVKSLRDRVINGLEILGNLTIWSNTGSKCVSIRPSYLTEKFSFNFGLDVGPVVPVLSGATVLDFHGWMVGYQMAIDIGKCHLIENNLCLSFPAWDFDLCAYVNGGHGIGATVYQEIMPGFEAALSLVWSAEKEAATFEIGAQYQWQDDTIRDTVLRAKVSNTSQIGLGYQQHVCKGVVLTMSANIDCKDFENGNHMFGLAIEFEPQSDL